MTESEWLTSDDAAAMLEVLRDRTGDRKLRLFACACARDIWSHLSEDCMRAVEVAERFADGAASLEELREAGTLAYETAWSRGFGGEDARADYVAQATAREFSMHAAAQAVENRLDTQHLGDIVRTIFGNPFRPSAINPAWLDRDGGRLRTLAQAIDDARTFGRTPELAGALSAAGCVDETLLAPPLRSGLVQFRGGWVLDLLLGKGRGKDVVTEEEWWACVQPRKLFEWWRYLRGEPAPRKRRLLACACCRRIGRGLWAEELRRAVEAAERYADGLINPDDLAAAQARAEAIAGPVGERLGHLSSGTEEHRSEALRWSAAWASASAAQIRGQGLYVCTVSTTPIDNSLDYASTYRDYADKGGLDEQREQCQLFRDIFGNPFRSITVDPVWLVWNSGAVLGIARRIDEERCFEAMPLLGDALEDAGCTDTDILSHCRGPEPHAPGCWLLDQILDKGSITLEEAAATPTVLVEREL